MTLAPASLEPPPWRPRSIEAGGWRITALSDGFLRLDGGSMWGVVPATLWRRWTPPAEDNTILLALRPFLLQRDGLNVVLEPGVGQRWSEKLKRIYGLLPTATVVDTLAACGVAPDEVQHVIASHCHWDHVGAWVVERDGELQPLFPAARHHAPAVEVEVCLQPGHARDGSYRPKDVAPLIDAGLMQPYGDGEELVPGVRAHVLGGHSDGVAVLTVGEEDPGPTAVFWADVVPTAHHAQPRYIMAYDIDVARSFEVRSAWLERAAREGWIGLFYHDVDHAFGTLAPDGGRYAFTPVAGEARAEA